MLKARSALVDYINAQRNKADLAKRWNISLAAIYNIRNKANDLDGTTIAQILIDTGFDFEKAFETVGQRTKPQAS